MKRKPPPNQKVLTARFAAQMSRATLAKKSDVSAKTIWNLEKKGGFTRMENAKRISAGLGETVTNLFDEDSVIG